MLDQLSQTLTQLHHLALDIQKALLLQNALLTRIEEGTEKNIVKLQAANTRLDKIKKSLSSGMWIPRILLLIVLGALVVFAVSVL